MKKLKFLLLIIFAGLAGCLDIPDKLIMPEWDVNLNVPLLNRVYKIIDMVKGGEEVSADPVDNVLILTTKEYAQLRNIVDFIKLNQAITRHNINIPPSNTSRDIYLSFRSDVVEIKQAVFSSGYINLTLRNQSSLNVQLKVTIPGISLNSVPYVLQIPMKPDETKSLHQDLKGYSYSIPGNQPSVFNNDLWIIAESQATGNNTRGDINFDVEISDFTFSSVTGKFSEQDLGIKTDTISAELGSDIEDMRNKAAIRSASLQLSAVYQSVEHNPFSLEIDNLTIQARHGNDIKYLTDSTGSRNMHLLVSQGNAVLNFNETNSNIIDLINMLPDYFIVSASFKILGNNQLGTVTNKDISGVSFNVSARSIFSLARSGYTDTLRVKLNREERDGIRKALFTTVDAEVTSRIPLKGWIRIDFLDSIKVPVYTLRALNGDSLFVDAAPVDPVTGMSSNISTASRHFELTVEDMNKLASSYYMVIHLEFETAGYIFPKPPYVTLRASDWIKVSAGTIVKYHVDDNAGKGF